MALTPGARFGGYEVLQLEGAGGMGEVYRARDSKLGRDVALKVLPDRFAGDPHRSARLTREAQVLAALNHPSVAAIHGVEEYQGGLALVLEWVPGPTLADRIAAGALPLEAALPIARQIAEALEAAHARGIVHRDLKPANIKVRADGTVKVLDFGLGKALNPDAAEAAGPHSVTVTRPAATLAGEVLGTAGYMAPEQATGTAADSRADVWAFGVVLFEMLAGRRPFEGDTVSEAIGAVLKSEPDWSHLPPHTPDGIRRLLRRCLQKDPARRLHHIADARLEIEETISAPSAAAVTSLSAGGAHRNGLLLLALAAAVLIAVVQTARLRQLPTVAPAPESRLEIAASMTEVDAGGDGFTEPPAVSPDGLQVVYAQGSEGQTYLWLRALDSATPQRLAGTEGALLPFWSPDSRSVGFFAGNRLKRIDLDGGAVTVLATAPFARGGSWSATDTIAFSPHFSGALLQVSAAGGDVRSLTTLLEGQAQHTKPQFLPDGRHLLYHAADAASSSSGAIYVADSDNPGGRRLLDAEAAAFHRPSGRLLFVRQGVLFAQPFDLASLELSGVASTVARPAVAVSTSDAGPIAYRGTTSRGRRQFVWFDRSGRELGRVGEADVNIRDGDPDLSPDGTQLAVHRVVDGNRDIWLLELARGVFSRFISDPRENSSPRWSPDGKTVVFNSNRSGAYDLYTQGLAGREDRLLLSTDQSKSATDWSSDGRFILFRSVDPVTSHDLWALPLEGTRTPFPVARTPFVDAYGQFSPDGKWVAFQSDESGRPEVYVQAFPTPGVKVRVSTDGGAQMRWRRDGRELYYIALDGRMMAVSIQPRDAALVAGKPMSLFQTRVGDVVPPQSGYYQSYVISPDGSRFLISTAVEETRAAPITLILNWRPN